MDCKNFLKLGVIGITLSLAALAPNANAISMVAASSASRVASSQSHNHHGVSQADTPATLQAKAELSDKLLVVLGALGGIGAVTALAGIKISRTPEPVESKVLTSIESKPNFLNKIGNLRTEYNPTTNNNSNKNGYGS